MVTRATRFLLVPLALLMLMAVCSSEIVDLSTPGETVDDAIQEAQQALAASPMNISINTVGFDLGPGSEAEKYLQQIAQIGGGSYFAASDTGQLTQALAGAATGQVSTYGNVPVITSPQNGEMVGPSTLVEGMATPGAVVVLQTEVYEQIDGTFVKMVPGHRHVTNADGSFSLLIATPRVSFGQKRPLRYEIHAFTVTQDGTKSQHAIVTVEQELPTP